MDQIKIGQFIKKKRIEKGLTQNQLGELLGVSGKTISRWETAKYMPDLSMLIPLSEQLEISLNELLNGEEIIDKNDESILLTLEYTNHQMIHKQKYKTMLCIIHLLILFTSYFICRYVFFEIHGMKELPLNLLTISIPSIIVMIYANYTYMTYSMSFGYGLTFIIACIFNKNSYDSGGGTMNNFWIIWMVSYFSMIILGLLMDVLKIKYKTKK